MSATPAVVSSKDDTLFRSNCGWIRTPRALTSDMSSSSENFQTKARKPYTITKQREKWTEQEHEKFLEALKLYGRSWQHIKEHIGTKTAVQIRSHAQKFFFKVERGASDTSSNGQDQEIKVPPPRPKRRPNHPYPRKRGISTSLCEEIGDTYSTSYSMFEPTVSSLVDNKGPGPGPLRCEDSYKEGNTTIKSQLGLHSSKETHMEALTSTDGIDASLGAPSKTNVSELESKRPPGAESAHILPIIEGSSTPLNLFQGEVEPSPYAAGKIQRQPSNNESQPELCAPAHKQSAYFSPPWQVMQASLMNHPAVFAAAMVAAATFAFRGAGTASEANSCKHPSAEDLNAAAYAAASASWWAFNGFVPPPFSHQGQAITFSQANMPRTKDNITEQLARAIAMRTEVVPSLVERGEKFNINKMPDRTLASDISAIAENDRFIMCNLRGNQKNPIDELDGLFWKLAREGSSSGSNTPALVPNARSPSENDNDETFCRSIEEECATLHGTIQKSGLRALGEEDYVTMKHKNMETGKHQQKDLRQGENENGKRFKSGTHDTDVRREVSLQGRKAFEALFTGGALPQRFGRRGKEGVEENAKTQTVSGLLKHSDVMQAGDEGVGSVACAVIMEGVSEYNTPFPGPSTSVSIKSRIGGRSGFTPYKKPPVASRASASPLKG